MFGLHCEILLHRKKVFKHAAAAQAEVVALADQHAAVHQDEAADSDPVNR